MKNKIMTLASIALVSFTGITASGCSGNSNTVLIYSCSEDEVNANLKEALSSQFPDYNIVIQYLGTGETYTKLYAEGKNTDADIVFDLDGCYAQKLVNEKNCFADLSEYDFSVFKDEVVSYSSQHKRFLPECKTDVVVAYNKKVLANNHIDVPTTYSDLLDAKYKNLISISNPKASGTGYTFYNTMVSNIGLDNTIAYFNGLKSNIKDITSSGSAPLKAVNRGEVAIGFAMLWQTVMYANDNPDIGYTFLDKPTGYNVYTFEMIDGKQTKTAVKNVFDYMANTWNIKHCRKFYPDAIYKNQGASEIPNYPVNVPEVIMSGLYDFSHKQTLLDAWPL